ncbi:UvrD-helicase domain-containing protein [Chromatium okenii]|uniref:UvrD-helicase domain-containing protein n=1 Tax=Chromatium okenii TaxID=61644 RepID=UPI0018D57AE5|nr:UvrD-helicase domain-containing protein [Chromatium okenii]
MFTRELVTDQTELLAEVVRDYWRVHFYPLEPAQAALMLGVVKSPEELQKKLKVLLARREIPLAHQGQLLVVDSLADVLAQAQLQHGTTSAEFVASGSSQSRTAIARAARAFQRQCSRQRQCRQIRGIAGGNRGLGGWCAAPNKLLSFAQGAFRFRKGAKIQTEIVHPAFQALANLQQYQAQPQLPFAAQVLAHAKQWVAKTLDERQQLRAEMGFDDLLRELEAALARSAADAPNGASSRLAAIIRAQFPVALIDEFQDTDPLQYLIFNHIYGVAANNPNTALILIGDRSRRFMAFAAQIFTPI